MGEIEFLSIVDDAFSKMEDDDARSRVLQWIVAKYGVSNCPPAEDHSEQVSHNIVTSENEIPGIAKVSDSGEFKLTIRDPKAKNANDAAIRIAHVVLRAYEKLIGETEISSKNILVPILREWRAYTGNTRKALANHKGILREGDNISLDAHSKHEADEYIANILDAAIDSKWKPSSKVRKGKLKG